MSALTQKIINLSLTFAFAFVLASGLQSGDVVESEPIAEITAQERVKARFEAAAQKVCGENASYILDGAHVKCTTKRGFVTALIGPQS